MLKPVLKWVLIVLSLVAIGPGLSRLLTHIHDADGGHAITLLINADLGMALLAGAAVLGVACLVGVLGSHFFSLSTGMTSAGLILAWGAWQLGTLEDVVRRAGSGKDLRTLALEGGGVTLLAAGMAGLCTWASRRAQGRQGLSAPAPGITPLLIVGGAKGEPAMPVLLTTFAAATVAGSLGVWLVAVNGMRGQTLMAALVGGLAAGIVAHVVSSSKGFSVTPVVPIAGLAVAAIAGPIAAQMMHGAGLVEAVYAGNVFNLARPISLNWGAGGLLGVPIGLSWAGSMLDRRLH